MNATLNLTNVQLANDGSMFRCVATGNVTSDTAKLTVNAVPTILTQPSDQTVLAGQTAAFSVAASDGTTPYSYQWQV